MKTQTLARVIELVLSEGEMSRTDISRRLGLSASMVTDLTAELIERGVLVESGYRSAQGKGRRNQLLDIDTSLGFALGAGLYKTTLSVGLCTIKGETLSHRIITLPEEASGEEIISLLLTASQEILSDCRIPEDKILGLGLCLTKPDRARLGIPDTEPIILPSVPESIPIMVEPADRIIAYSESAHMPVDAEGMYVFGCGRVVREVVVKNA